MTIDECIEAYRRFSILSERHFANGDDRAGSEMLYGALTQIIIAIAIRRGDSFREHQHRRHTIRILARELGEQTIVDDFGKAQRLHVHFFLNDLHGVDFTNAINATRSLIHRLLPLAT